MKNSQDDNRISLVLLYEESNILQKNLQMLDQALQKLGPGAKFEVIVFYQNLGHLEEIIEKYASIRFWRLPFVKKVTAFQLLRQGVKRARNEYLVFISNDILLARKDIYYAAEAASAPGVLASFLPINRFFTKKYASPWHGLFSFFEYSMARALRMMQRFLFYPLPAKGDIVAFNLLPLRSLGRIVSFTERKAIIREGWAKLNGDFIGFSIYLDFLCTKYNLSWVSPGAGRSIAVLSGFGWQDLWFRSYHTLKVILQLSYSEKVILNSLNMYRFIVPVSHLVLLVALVYSFIDQFYAMVLFGLGLGLQLPMLFYGFNWRKPIRSLLEITVRTLMTPFL